MLEPTGAVASAAQIAAVLLASVLCGFVGTFVVLRRLVALGGGIAHAAFGGIGLALVLGFAPRLGAAVVAAGAAILIAGLPRERSDRQDAMIGVLWAAGMALGMLLLAGTPAGDSDVEGFLFGDIDAVDGTDVATLAALVAIVLVVHLRWGRALVATAFDPEHARIRGLPVRGLTLLGLLLVALSIVALLEMAGIVLAIALLAIPPLVALRWLRGLPAVVAGTTILSAAMSLAGIGLGAATGWPAGPTIVLVGAATLALSALAPARPSRSG
jgi:zinc transport system permease protein